jgi:hypothetical protein
MHSSVKTSVVDPGHFGMDPDPEVCTTNLRIQFFGHLHQFS